MSFTQVPVVGTYLDSGGQPATGAVSFTPVTPMRNGAIVVGATKTVTVTAGQLTTTVAATDDPATTPIGVVYRVVEQVGGVLNRYAIAVPAASGTVDLGTVARAEPSTPELVSKADAVHTHPAPQMPYPLTGYGLAAASFDLSALSSQANSFTANTIEVTRMWLPAGVAAVGVCAYVSTAGVTATAAGASGFAVYSDTGDLLGTTPTDYTLWTSTGWRKGVLSAPVAATTTGRWVRVAQIHTCSTAPKVPTQIALGAVLLNSHVLGSSHRRQVFAAATAFPASINPTTFGSLDSPTLFVALY